MFDYDGHRIWKDGQQYFPFCYSGYRDITTESLKKMRVKLCKLGYEYFYTTINKIEDVLNERKI